MQNQIRTCIKLTAIPLIVASLAIGFSSGEAKAKQVCFETGPATGINIGKCPSAGKQWAKIVAFSRLRKKCRLPRRTKPHQMKMSFKLLSSNREKRSNGITACTTSWRVCTNCSLSK